MLKRCNKCGALLKVLKDCNCDNCGITCCGETLQNSVMCFGKPFDGVYLAFSDSSSVGRTPTAVIVAGEVTGSSPVYPITKNKEICLWRKELKHGTLISSRMA